jgi:RNA polymerase sigma-70 factor, ECF subfamily
MKIMANEKRFPESAGLAEMLPDMVPRLWAFALRISGNQQDAEDLVQWACLRGLERADQLKTYTSPLGWMFSIVHSIWINESRARSRRGRAYSDWDDALLETIADPAVSDPKGHASIQQIVNAVGRLPESERTAVLLVTAEGFSYSEAAKILDVSIGTIMSRLSQARKTIGASLGVRQCRRSSDTIHVDGIK